MKRRKTAAAAMSKPLDRRELLEREFSTAVVAFHQSIAASLGLNAAEWKCLGVLEAGTMTAGRLAELSGFTTGAITAIVDRLERASLVRREPNPADRRSVLIRPVRLASVKRRVAPIFASLRAAMAAVADSFQPDELAAIQSYFSQAIQVLRAETGKLRGPRRTVPGV
ncbi:MAG: MarR family transcriptional regulator [Terracidiphilus sp.]